MLGSPADLLIGLGSGICLGFLLQKGRASKHDVVMGQLLLRNWTLVKMWATAVAVGAVGVWAMVATGASHVTPPPAQWVGVLVGAVMFGVGLAILGTCPVTTIAAIGEGKRDARTGLAGMVAGAFAFVVLHDVIAPIQRTLADLRPLTWPALTHTSPWPWVAGVVLLALSLYAATRLRLRPVRNRS